MGREEADTQAERRWLRQTRQGTSLAAVIALPLVAGILLLPQAFALARALHLLVIERQPLAAAMPWLVLVAALLLVRALLVWSSEIKAQRAAEHIKQNLRRALMQQLLRSGVLWSRARPSGALADAITTQVEMLEGYFARYLPATVSAACLPLLFCAVLAAFNWVAALILLLTLPVIPLFMMLVGWGAEAASRRHATALTRLSGLFADRVRGLLTLKLHGRAEAESQRVAAASNELAERSMKVLRIAFMSSAVLEFFAALGLAGMALYFGLSFLGFVQIGGTPSLAVALFCLLMAPEAYWPLRQMAAHYHDRAHARAAVGEIVQLFDGLPEAQTHATTAELPLDLAQGFTIGELLMPIPGRPTLRMATGELRPGDCIALSGRSGSGKTTLLETLAGLRPFEGEVLFGGQPLAAISQTQLRQQVLLISQRPWLAPGSIADNLRLIAPDADDAALMRALGNVGLAAWVQSLPQGLDTPLGMRGQGASGGQAQRLALARMFLSDAKVLLLDEPTAHLDAASRSALLDALTEFVQGRTVLLASHDPAVLAWAHKRWHIESDGEIHA